MCSLVWCPYYDFHRPCAKGHLEHILSWVFIHTGTILQLEQNVNKLTL